MLNYEVPLQAMVLAVVSSPPSSVVSRENEPMPLGQTEAGLSGGIRRVDASRVEWTEAGHLRHCVFIGMRDDKEPEGVVRELSSPNWRLRSSIPTICLGTITVILKQRHLRHNCIQMALAFWTSRIVYVAAKFGLADHLSNGPKSADELAGETGTHAPSLYRVMR